MQASVNQWQKSLAERKANSENARQARLMTKEERARKALVWMMNKVKEHNLKLGIELTEQQAFNEVIQFARTGDKMRELGEFK